MPNVHFIEQLTASLEKIGRISSEEVILQLIKCIPVLLYGLEVCALNKTQIASLDFVINRFFMKLFVFMLSFIWKAVSAGWPCFSVSVLYTLCCNCLITLLMNQ